MAARLKGGGPVRRAHADRDAGLPQLDAPDPVLDRHLHAPPVARLRRNAAEELLGHGNVGVVLQIGHLPPARVVPYLPHKGHHRPVGNAGHTGGESVEVDGLP